MVTHLGSGKRVDWLISQLEIMGGAEKMVLNCVPLLRNAGWDVKVIVLAAGGESIAKLSAASVPVTLLHFGANSNPLHFKRLFYEWNKDRPDIVHTHLYHAGIIGRFVGKLLGISPLLVHQHGPELNRSRLRSFLDRSTSRWVSRYIASCQAVGRTLQEREEIPASRIEVIYNGIDINQQYQSVIPDGWLKKKGHCTVVYAGRLSPEKGLSTLIKALSSVGKSHRKFQCLLLGDGPARQQITNEIEENNLQGLVHLAGHKDEISAWLRNCDIFVLPSIWEGASLALLEAMAARLPVIATAVGGTPELVEDGVSGILVPEENPSALATAIIQLLDSKEQRQRMGESGYRCVDRKFRVENTVEQITKLYSEYSG